MQTTETEPTKRRPYKRPVLKLPAAKSAELHAARKAKPLPNIMELSGSRARINVPANLRKLEMVHEYCTERDEPLPEYRSLSSIWTMTKREEREFYDELTRLDVYAPMVFRRLWRMSRHFQATEAGILRELQVDAKYKACANHVRRGMKALRDAGLVERIPARNATGACGWVVRLKHRYEWPSPYNPAGMTLKAIKKANPSYSDEQGRIVDPERSGRPFRSKQGADQYILDGITGEVINKTTGVVLFIVIWQVRNTWGASRFLGPSAGKLANVRPSQTSGSESNVDLSQSRRAYIEEEIKEGGVNRNANLILSGKPDSRELRSPTGTTSLPSDGPLVPDCPTGDPGDNSDPVNSDSPDAISNPDEGPDIGPFPEEDLSSLDFFNAELTTVQKEWEQEEHSRDPDEPWGYGKFFDPENSRYHDVADGRDVVPFDAIMSLPPEQMSTTVQAPYYLGTRGKYTATIVERWYRNSPDGLLVRELLGDDEGLDLTTARLFMRRFVDRFRAGTHEELYRRLAYIAMVGRTRIARGEDKPTYAYVELKDCRRLSARLRREERPDAVTRIADVAAFASSSIELAHEFDGADTLTTHEFEQTIIAPALARRKELGSDWVPGSAFNKHAADYVLLTIGAAWEQDDAHLDQLLDATNRTWRLMALHSTEVGRAVIRHFRAGYSSESTTALWRAFGLMFRMLPEDVMNEHNRAFNEAQQLNEMLGYN